MIPTAYEMAVRYEREKAEYLEKGYSPAKAQEVAMLNVRAWLLHCLVDDGASAKEVVRRVKDDLRI